MSDTTMKQSFSRAAVSQWLALAVDWKGLVTCTHSHRMAARLEIAHHLRDVAADLGVEGLARELPDLLGARAVGGVGHHHVGGQTVGEGPDLARGAAGRGLAGEREGADAGLRLLAGEQVDHVGLLVDPGAAGVLVEAHGPERHHLAIRIGVVIGEQLQLGLEVLDVLVGVALGELGDEVEGVGLEAPFEFVEGDQPVGAGAGRRPSARPRAASDRDRGPGRSLPPGSG